VQRDELRDMIDNFELEYRHTSHESKNNSFKEEIELQKRTINAIDKELSNVRSENNYLRAENKQFLKQKQMLTDTVDELREKLKNQKETYEKVNDYQLGVIGKFQDKNENLSALATNLLHKHNKKKTNKTEVCENEIPFSKARIRDALANNTDNFPALAYVDNNFANNEESELSEYSYIYETIQPNEDENRGITVEPTGHNGLPLYNRQKDEEYIQKEILEVHKKFASEALNNALKNKH